MRIHRYDTTYARTHTKYRNTHTKHVTHTKHFTHTKHVPRVLLGVTLVYIRYIGNKRERETNRYIGKKRERQRRRRTEGTIFIFEALFSVRGMNLWFLFCILHVLVCKNVCLIKYVWMIGTYESMSTCVCTPRHAPMGFHPQKIKQFQFQIENFSRFILNQVGEISEPLKTKKCITWTQYGGRGPGGVLQAKRRRCERGG